jgi:hypothetical protein
MARFTLQQLVDLVNAHEFLTVEQVYPKRVKVDGFNMVYVACRPVEEIRKLFFAKYGTLTQAEFNKKYSEYYTKSYKEFEAIANCSENVAYNALTRESSPYLAVHYVDTFNPHSYMGKDARDCSSLPADFLII